MAHCLAHNLKKLCHNQITKAHQYLSIYPPTPADSRGNASKKRLQIVGAVARRPGPSIKGGLTSNKIQEGAKKKFWTNDAGHSV